MCPSDKSSDTDEPPTLLLVLLTLLTMAAVGAWVGRELLDPATHLFTTARYNACPTIRYMPDGFFCKPHATPLPEPHVCTTFCRNILHKGCLHEHDDGISRGTVALQTC